MYMYWLPVLGLLVFPLFVANSCYSNLEIFLTAHFYCPMINENPIVVFPGIQPMLTTQNFFFVILWMKKCPRFGALPNFSQDKGLYPQHEKCIHKYITWLWILLVLEHQCHSQNMIDCCQCHRIIKYRPFGQRFVWVNWWQSIGVWYEGLVC